MFKKYDLTDLGLAVVGDTAAIGLERIPTCVVSHHGRASYLNLYAKRFIPAFAGLGQQLTEAEPELETR